MEKLAREVPGRSSGHRQVSGRVASITVWHGVRSLVGGLLPTERSGSGPPSRATTNSCLPGGRIPRREPVLGPACNDLNGNDVRFGTRKKYEEDQTKQHVYDMVGNVRELCADAYVPTPS